MLVKEWARLEGLHPQTVWKWCRQGTMPVPVEQTPTGMWLIHDPKYETMPQSKSMEPRTVCYARVSSCVCSIESGPCERVESLQMSGRF